MEADAMVTGGPPAAAAVSVVIVTYNSAGDLPACLASLPEGVEVILLDNASEDGSADLAAALMPQARVIRSAENLGFARGANLAAAEARGAFLLFFNPDAQLEPDALGLLLAAAEAWPGAGIFGADARALDGTRPVPAARHWPNLFSLVWAAAGLRPLYDPEAMRATSRIVPADVVIGGCMLVRRALWDRLAGFDPRYFMYGEDADLCARARAAGSLSVLVGRAEYRHRFGGSQRSRRSMMGQLFAGQITLYDRHGPEVLRRWAPRILGVHCLLRSLGLAPLALVSPRMRAARQVWVGIWQDRAGWQAGYPSKKAV